MLVSFGWFRMMTNGTWLFPAYHIYPVSKGWQSGCMCGCTLSPIMSSDDVWNGKQKVKEEIWIWNAYLYTLRKLRWRRKMDLLKMYSLLTMGIFHCHVCSPRSKRKKNQHQLLSTNRSCLPKKLTHLSNPPQKKLKIEASNISNFQSLPLFWRVMILPTQTMHGKSL